MKKIILCLLLVGILFLVASCNNTIDLSELENERHATLLMLDGSIIQGTCTNFARYSDNWAYIKIDGVKYYLDTWRIILKEK